ncbi:MAG: hypothetical protein C4555_01830 [Dehalococcoidia bacterium]|jgi:hypothetical protein|nr:MAG: hypothetical protein C4555_01830 [Dehalococcoidia bacterium]
MRNDWNRQPGESPRAHALFSSYLDLGPGRSLPALARSEGISLSYLKKLSANWRWQERALAWQGNLTASDDEELVKEARERQLRDAVTLQQLARAQLSRWVARDPEGTSRLIRQLNPTQVARFWQTGFHLENELLPPIKPPQEIAVAEQIKETEKEQAEIKHPSFSQCMKRLLRAARKAGLRGPRLEAVRTKFLRWLWLPEEADLETMAHPMLIAKGDHSCSP